MNKIILKIFVHILIAIILTALTQIGGMIWLVNICFYRFINIKLHHPIVNKSVKLLSFFLLYLLFSFVILPPIAKRFNRVPLPVTKQDHIQPLNIMTCVLNRHWVRTELRDVISKAATEMNNRHPGSVTNYLDANFPLFNGFPLIPHLSHNDGKKLDIAFFYTDAITGKEVGTTPSFIGYGISEEAGPGELDISNDCRKQGFWQYSLMRNLMPQSRKSSFKFDSGRTRTFLEFCASEKGVGKIFIEPHLKTRMGLRSSKIRFHGCQAVRHDDHIHLQIN